MIPGTPSPTLYPGRSVCSATRPCQECGNHTTSRTQHEVWEKFINPFKLDDKYDFQVDGSYWTVWNRDRVRLHRGKAKNLGCGSEGKRSFQRAQV